MGVECNACGQPLHDARPDDPTEGRPPCPACGSKSRLVKVSVHDEVTFHADLGLKKRSPGFKSGGRFAPLPGAMVWRSTERERRMAHRQEPPPDGADGRVAPRRREGD